MREFDGKGYEWRVEIMHKRNDPQKDSYSTTDGFLTEEFENYWGCQYEWVSMLPIAWKIWSVEDARIKAPSMNELNVGSWWATPLHLLGLGLGWSDIGKGLYEWQRQCFPFDHELLKFIYNTWGPSIEALQLWLRMRPENAIESSLTDLRDSKFFAFRLDSQGAVENCEFALQQMRDGFESRKLLGKRSSLAKRLLSDDYDSFHLTDHFVESVWPNEDKNSKYFVTDDYVEEGVKSQELDSGTKTFEISLPRYAGFHVALNAVAAGYTGETVYDGGETMRVSLDGFGFLGEFMRHEKTNRWFLNSKDVERSADVHMWGN